MIYSLLLCLIDVRVCTRQDFEVVINENLFSASQSKLLGFVSQSSYEECCDDVSAIVHQRCKKTKCSPSHVAWWGLCVSCYQRIRIVHAIAWHFGDVSCIITHT